MEQTRGESPELPVDILFRSEETNNRIGRQLEKLGWKVCYGQAPVDGLIYTANEPIIFERKTTSDFGRSILDGSLVRQLSAMKAISSKCFLIVEGSWSNLFAFSNLNEKSVIGFMDECIEKGVYILWVRNTFWTIQWLDHKLRELKGLVKKRNFKLRPSARLKLSRQKQAEYVLSGLPGLGPVGITYVKKHFANLASFIGWVLGDGFVGLPKRLVKLKTLWHEILLVDWSEK